MYNSIIHIRPKDDDIEIDIMQKYLIDLLISQTFNIYTICFSSITEYYIFCDIQEAHSICDYVSDMFKANTLEIGTNLPSVTILKPYYKSTFIPVL